MSGQGKQRVKNNGQSSLAIWVGSILQPIDVYRTCYIFVRKWHKMGGKRQILKFNWLISVQDIFSLQRAMLECSPYRAAVQPCDSKAYVRPVLIWAILKNIYAYQPSTFIGRINEFNSREAGSMQVHLAQLSRIFLSQWNNAYV